MSVRGFRHGVWIVAAVVSVALPVPRAQSPAEPDAAGRVTERLRALQREADELATREKTLLVELRGLELQRQIKNEELGTIDRELQQVQQQLTASEARAAALSHTTETARPDVEARLVRLYKIGRIGFWKLLLSSDDLRAMGRAYRLASAMVTTDRTRVQEHRALLDRLAGERAAIEGRAREMRVLRDRADAARAALDRAVSERTALIASIDERRDLAAQMAGELRAARDRLERAAGESAATGPATRVPLRPFKGDLPWPANGIVLGRFGQTSTGAKGLPMTSNGIDVSVAEGRPVLAIHEGAVTFAAPLTGFGNVVIVDHGDRAQSLYGHLASLDVHTGERVTAGTRLGSSGRNVAGNPSLYFELRIDGKPVDPLQWLRPQP